MKYIKFRESSVNTIGEDGRIPKCDREVELVFFRLILDKGNKSVLKSFVMNLTDEELSETYSM